jgi:ribose transport system ATP-binding protein
VADIDTIKTFESAVPAAPGDLAVREVSKTFAGQQALKRVSIDFRPGEVHCLLGQNGSGKSTLVKILSGFHAPDAGSRVMVGDENLAFGDPDSSRRLGFRFVHQQLGVIGAMSAVENTALGFGRGSSQWGFHHWKKQEDSTRELLARIGATDLDVRRPLRDARAVDRTAVAIARAVDPIAGPISYLFLDEPTAALPPAEVTRLFELIGEVKSHGTGIIYVSHRLDEVFEIGERVSILRDGSHVGTFAVSDLDQRGLIELIVGEAVRDRVAERLDGSSSERQSGPSSKVVLNDSVAAHPPEPDSVGAPTSTATTAPLLSIRNLHSSRIANVSFDLAKGEILGVTGLAGSGRESIVYAIIGAQRSKAAAIEMAGSFIGRSLTPRTAKLLGIVLAPGNRMPGSAVAQFSLRENITLPALRAYRRLRMVDKAAEREVTQQWLSDLKVGGAQHPGSHNRLFSQLSGGNQQKVILAKAFNVKPNVVLLDEPTAGVDVGAREAIYEVIGRYAAAGVSFVIASSDIDDLLAVCDRVLVMSDGRIYRDFKGSEITEAALLDAVMHTGRATETGPRLIEGLEEGLNP